MARSKAKRQSDVQHFDLSFVVGPAVPPPVTAVSHDLSDDRRRQKRRKTQARAPSPRRRAQAPATTAAEDMFMPEAENVIEVDVHLAGAHIEKGAGVNKRKRKIYTSDEPLREFINVAADDYARVLLSNEGRGSEAERPCPRCSDAAAAPEFRCATCFGGGLYCAACCIEEHRSRPFCRIEKWNGISFDKVSLQSLGLRVQVGHPEGEACRRPQPANVDFTVIHLNGLHSVSVDFCNCCPGESAVPYREQLLAHRLFPATIHDPQTCCSFQVLDQFYAITLQGKLTAYDYYGSLERLTDNPGTEWVKDRYKSFLRCVRIWRYLKKLKWSGRANDAERPPSDIKPGELALTCPACPRPGVNLPPGWQSAPPEEQYLYVLIIALDACFRLKRRKISSRERDPGLADGGSYLVESGPFEDYLKNTDDQTDISTCTGLSAVDHANTKFSKGYAETGKVMGICARHEFVQKNGVVPTQVGERYANTDYALGSLLRHHSPTLSLLISYDISCQYSKKFATRIQRLPALVCFMLVVAFVRFVIPKLHIHGHKPECQLLFNLNWTWGVGRTDGEGVERPWGFLGPLGMSLRQMGPGSAADTLDDHFGHWNWLKLIGLGVLLRRRLIDALLEQALQKEELEEFRRGQGSKTKGWEKEVDEFERGNKEPNPFEMPKHGATEADVALELANEEEEQARRGLEFRHSMAPSAFVLALLDIENDQRTLRLEIRSKQFESSTQHAELSRRRTKLLRSINKLNEVQGYYTPAVLARVATWKADLANANISVEDMPLFPPSQLTAAELEDCSPSVVEIERRLREAQCRTSLDTMRNLLTVQSRLLTYKNVNVRNQAPNTRARATLAKNKAKIDRQAYKYVNAHRALVRLAGGDVSKVQWHALDVAKDVRCMDDGDEDKLRGKKRAYNPAEATEEVSQVGGAGDAGSHLQRCRDATGEGRRKTSWIWKDVDTTNPENAAMYSGIKVEYCKAYSRVKRWSEEVPLLREEMRRTTVSLSADASRWDAIRQGEKRTGALGEGARAFAHTQAAMFRRLGAHFESLWATLPKSSVAVTSAQAETLRVSVDAAENAGCEQVEGEDLEAGDAEDIHDDDSDDGER